MADQGSRNTGTSDATYNLISVAYHALQGAENYERYAQDAQQQGDQELASFFRNAQEQARQCADQAEQLLAGRLPGGEMGMGRTAAATTGAMGHAGNKPQTSGE